MTTSRRIRERGLLIVPTFESTSAPVDPSWAGNYFVSTYPPFSCWSPEGASELVSALLAAKPPDELAPMGLYVHVPFCVERCRYCYYLSSIAQSREAVDEYLEALDREISLYAETACCGDRRASFAYFGGGTPSLLGPDQIERLCDSLDDRFAIREAREVTFECAPQTVSPDKLRAAKAGGVSRISLGVQQLNDRILELNGRVHKERDVERAYAAIREAGFACVNLDLIVGLVGETDETFEASLERVIEMAPDSVTIYQLEIPLNTPLYRSLQSDRALPRPASWHLKRQRLSRGFDRLSAAGYTSRSAYTAHATDQGFVYQDEQYRGADILGLGVSSFSYLGGVHFQSSPKITDYKRHLSDGHLAIQRAHVLTPQEQSTRELILQLKLGKLDRGYFRAKFGIDPLERHRSIFGGFVGDGLMTSRGDRLQLTRNGLLQVDHLIRRLYLPEHQGARYS